MYIAKMVKDLVVKHSTNNPFELADCLKIRVIHWQLHQEINGLYQYCDKNKFIYINVNLSTSDKKFICSHELGHAILHPRINCTFLKQFTYYSTDKLENEANLFAAHLLLNNDILNEFHNCTYEQISVATGIPTNILIQILNN